ncbi:cyclase family protein [Bradyrhizobium sp. DASA03005]|uniref:cyclase family protein n=1 Tax=Bradyrhizobium sp. SPXBL-02 TaxID=3395912 RepID=UPI003F6FAA5A
MRPANFDHLADKLRNWGRWGEADQRGALNHIGPETLRNAAAEVRHGKLFNLGLRFDRNGPQLGRKRFNPMVYATDLFTPMGPGAAPGVCFSDDVIHMPLQCSTQWDALGHVHYDGQLYNGCNARECLTENGALKMGINHLAAPGIVSRGVLVDVARLKGVERLPLDYAITADDLNAACEKQGTSVGTGDILLVHTGHMLRFTADGDRDSFMGMQPGLSYTCAEWAYEKSLAAVAADNMAVEILDVESTGSEMPLPFHMLALRDMGLPLGEMFNLEALAADCAADGRYSFLLAAPPLEVTGGFGSPVNPQALK